MQLFEPLFGPMAWCFIGLWCLLQQNKQKLKCFACAACFRFQLEHILSEPGESWTGRKGWVDESMIQDFNKPDGSKCYICVCGPAAFTELTIRSVTAALLHSP